MLSPAFVILLARVLAALVPCCLSLRAALSLYSCLPLSAPNFSPHTSLLLLLAGAYGTSIPGLFILCSLGTFPYAPSSAILTLRTFPSQCRSAVVQGAGGRPTRVVALGRTVAGSTSCGSGSLGLSPVMPSSFRARSAALLALCSFSTLG